MSVDKIFMSCVLHNNLLNKHLFEAIDFTWNLDSLLSLDTFITYQNANKSKIEEVHEVPEKVGLKIQKTKILNPHRIQVVGYTPWWNFEPLRMQGKPDHGDCQENGTDMGSFRKIGFIFWDHKMPINFKQKIYELLVQV